MGRKKIEVQKIQDKQKRSATFRKRRDGLFKKALEIHLLTGADVHLSVIHNNTRYCLQQSKDTSLNTDLHIMDYTPQGRFKTRMVANKRCSFGIAQNGCGSNSSNSVLESADYKRTDNLKHRSVLYNWILSRLQNIFIDALFRRVLKKFIVILKNKEKLSNVPQPVSSISSDTLASKRTFQSGEITGASRPMLDAMQYKGVHWAGYLQPVSIKPSKKPPIPLVIQSTLASATGNNDDVTYQPNLMESDWLTELPLEDLSQQQPNYPKESLPGLDKRNSALTNDMPNDLSEFINNYTRGDNSTGSVQETTPTVEWFDFSHSVLSSPASLESINSPSISFCPPSNSTDWISILMGDDGSSPILEETGVPMN